MNTSRTASAKTPARPAKASVPSRVYRDLRISCTSASSSRQHADAASERAQVARTAAGACPDVRYVLDEMADDVAGVVVRHRVVALALAGVREPLARRRPPRGVERG